MMRRCLIKSADGCLPPILQNRSGSRKSVKVLQQPGVFILGQGYQAVLFMEGY